MYVEHPIFKKPENEEIKIWKYMDFTKFVSMLDNNSLFFTRSDKFEDPFEGTYSKANQILRPTIYKDSGINEEVFRQIDEFSKRLRQHILISCWHMNDHESAAMWKLYLQSYEGIAIQSTYYRFCKSFHDANENIYIGKVDYVDYDSDWIPEGNAFSPFLFKRKSFEHEREIRAIIDDSNINNESRKLPQFEIGTNINVDLNILIENVYVAPTSPKWFKDLASSLLRKYELNRDVIQSTLYQSPY
ncbi:hypothetical protein [Neobacillus sp. CF12]|uniref:hypothetical protein n=1 Tax=Neobacillus sp. CF12 TaxID=3055864 RepID=UPI0025A182E8|nr:hypothetical protein [Neobacillus sp. CF12]MDM5329846.1 hypothetical protein [Neobacillus sp. CF12]